MDRHTCDTGVSLKLKSGRADRHGDAHTIPGDKLHNRKVTNSLSQDLPPSSSHRDLAAAMVSIRSHRATRVLQGGNQFAPRRDPQARAAHLEAPGSRTPLRPDISTERDSRYRKRCARVHTYIHARAHMICSTHISTRTHANVCHAARTAHTCTHVCTQTRMRRGAGTERNPGSGAAAGGGRQVHRCLGPLHGWKVGARGMRRHFKRI